MAVLPVARDGAASPEGHRARAIFPLAVLAVLLLLPGLLLLNQSLPGGSSARVAEAGSQAQKLLVQGTRLTNDGAAANDLISHVVLASRSAYGAFTDRGSNDTPFTAYVSEVSKTAAVHLPETSSVASPGSPAPSPPGQLPLPGSAAAPVLSPVERWAAAGIAIETQGQLLDDHSLANVDAALSVLPPTVLSSLGNPALGPLHILVNPEGRTLSGSQPYRGPANFFSTNESANELVLYPQQSVFTIVHELGHAYNLRRVDAGRYAMVLLDSEMRDFLAATGWQITSSDAEIRAAVDHMHVRYTYTGSFHWPRVSNDDPLEDFANSFAMYFLDPKALSQSSPERYEWMAAKFAE